MADQDKINFSENGWGKQGWGQFPWGGLESPKDPTPKTQGIPRARRIPMLFLPPRRN